MRPLAGGDVCGRAPPEVATQARGERRRPGDIGGTGFRKKLEKWKTPWDVMPR